MTTTPIQPPRQKKPLRWHTGLNPLKHHIRESVTVEFDTVREARLRAGDLILACLDDERLLNFSLSHWPVLNRSVQDESLNVGYQMLWHFECDMGLEANGPHKTDAFYADIQFEMLKQAGHYLRQGQALPPDLLMMYKREEPSRKHLPLYYESYVHQVFKGVLRWVHYFKSKTL